MIQTIHAHMEPIILIKDSQIPYLVADHVIVVSFIIAIYFRLLLPCTRVRKLCWKMCRRFLLQLEFGLCETKPKPSNISRLFQEHLWRFLQSWIVLP